MTIPHIRRMNRGIGQSGRDSEKRVAKKMGGKLRPASGAMLGAKGDFQLPDFLVECKSTTNASMQLQHDWLCKIAAEARSTAKEPMLTVSFVNALGHPQRFGDWVMVPARVWRELTQKDE